MKVLRFWENLINLFCLLKLNKFVLSDIFIISSELLRQIYDSVKIKRFESMLCVLIFNVNLNRRSNCVLLSARLLVLALF